MDNDTIRLNFALTQDSKRVSKSRYYSYHI